MGSIFDWVWGSIQAVAEWWWGVLGEAWSGVWGFFGDLLGLVGEWILAALPSNFASWLSQRPWENLNQFLNFVDYWVPIYPAGGIIITVVWMVASIRLIRIILRVAPVVNG